MALLCNIALGVVAFIFLPYLATHIVLSLLPPRDLKKAYNAQWGLVTGSSSGASCCNRVCVHVMQNMRLPRLRRFPVL